jgi:hypothetical protein
LPWGILMMIIRRQNLSIKGLGETDRQTLSR